MFRYFCLLIICFVSSLSANTFDFTAGHHGWEGDFTDYPVNEEFFYELAWGWENLPSPITNPDGALLNKGLFLSGNNHSDDLFMFIRKSIDGLKPETFYKVTLSIIIESNVPVGLIGIGGSPGENVYVKAGASWMKPQKREVDGFYQLSVDKGNQAQGGENALVLGDLANSAVNQENPLYLPKELSSQHPLFVKTDSHGQLWIFIGTDSGFEGHTKFYIAQVTVDLEPTH